MRKLTADAMIGKEFSALLCCLYSSWSLMGKWFIIDKLCAIRDEGWAATPNGQLTPSNFIWCVVQCDDAILKRK